MPLVTASTAQKKNYDVIVVGSGAAGGQTAYALTLEGTKVLMLEAGRDYVPEKETPMFQTNAEAPLRGVATPDKPGGFYDATVGGGWTIPGEPYTNASADETNKFVWWRARMIGGRTNHWSQYAFRNGPYDFKGRSRDGLGFDWPINYEDLAPYYDKVEMLIGVYGSNEGLENTPDSPPGCLLPAPKGRVSELLIQQRAKHLGIRVIPARRAVLTRRLDAEALPAKLHPGNTFAQRIVRQAMESRAACLWATHCSRGCAVRATYQSTTVHLPPALATGNLDILSNAMAREVTLGPDGLASGVTFIDKTSGHEGHVAGRVVVLAASSCESARLLLNSKSTSFKDGLANSSGLVGRYIMDSVGTGLRGQIPLLENLPPHNEDGAGGGHMYAPWWLHQQQRAGDLGFPRAYYIGFAGGRQMPDIGTAAGLEWLTQGSYGRRFKEDARRYYGSMVYLGGRGEMLPNQDSFCEIDPEKKDKWGIPVLRFHWKWSEYEINQAAHMQKTFAEIISAMGGRIMGTVQTDGAKAIDQGGRTIHEVGGAIMGSDSRTSVTNQWGQTWDVRNLFITDGATFSSKSEKNPTLTIMALAWRSADHIIAEMKKGNL